MVDKNRLDLSPEQRLHKKQQKLRFYTDHRLSNIQQQTPITVADDANDLSLVIGDKDDKSDDDIPLNMNSNINNNNSERIFQWLLRTVPPSSNINSCFWYQSNIGLYSLRMLMNIFYSTTIQYYSLFGSSTNYIFWPFSIPIFVYYTFNKHRASLKSNEFIAKPDIRIICLFYSFLDSYIARMVTLKVLPKLGLMPEMLTAKTFDIRIPDNEHCISTVKIKLFAHKKMDLTYAPTFPPTEMQHIFGNESENDGKMVEEDTTDDEINNDFLNESSNNLLQSSSISTLYPTSKSSKVKPMICSRVQSMKEEQGLIIFIHGGGFLANFCASDLRILSQWSYITQAPIISIDYSLIPARFPTQMLECYYAYKYIINEQLFDYKFRKIVIVADSNGCNLAVSMILKLIVEKYYRLPDTLILASPILSLRTNPATSSQLLFMADPFIPFNLVLQCRNVYLHSDQDFENDFYISPLIACPDEILKHFPMTSMIVGSLDPFLDNSIDFALRLHNCGVRCQLKIYKFSPHSFLGFGYLLPNVSNAIHLIAEWIGNAFWA